jgi:hypothetical protein
VLWIDKTLPNIWVTADRWGFCRLKWAIGIPKIGSGLEGDPNPPISGLPKAFGINQSRQLPPGRAYSWGKINTTH